MFCFYALTAPISYLIAKCRYRHLPLSLSNRESVNRVPFCKYVLRHPYITYRRRYSDNALHHLPLHRWKIRDVMFRGSLILSSVVMNSHNMHINDHSIGFWGSSSFYLYFPVSIHFPSEPSLIPAVPATYFVPIIPIQLCPARIARAAASKQRPA